MDEKTFAVRYCEYCNEPMNPDSDICLQCGRIINKKAPKSNSESNLFLGYIFAVISLFFIPILFGGLGIYLGNKVKKNGDESSGNRLITVSIILMVIGMIIGAYVGATSFDF